MPNKHIKRCPLCGSFMKLRRWNRTILGGKKVRNTYCYCPTCDMRGPRVLYQDFECKADAEAKAIELVNRRAE